MDSLKGMLADNIDMQKKKLSDKMFVEIKEFVEMKKFEGLRKSM